MNITNTIIFIVGPTAVGKSEVALSLARKINGEIVSCDSMQIYKEINIASNKPSEQELHEIAHHLINTISVEEEFDVVQFSHLVDQTLEGIFERARLPIVVGGSGLYMQTLLDGIFEKASKDEQLRDELKNLADEKGCAYLHAQLQEKDPQAAQKIHPNDLRRIIRALEVYETQGAKISDLQKQREGLWNKYNVHVFVIDQDRTQLYEKINARVDHMVEEGLVDEIKNLHNRKLSKTAQKLIGVKEIRAYLNEEMDFDKAVDLMKQNTRHFAKRQWTWFRKDARWTWILREDYSSLNDMVNVIQKQIGYI